MRKFGLIGYPLSHSFSGTYFREKFLKENISDCYYSLYPIDKIEGLTEVLNNNPELEGLNVTIPYKEKVIAFLNEQDEVVQKMGACNCITINSGLLKGYNTDVIGFHQSLLTRLLPIHQNALILGTGGAAKAVAYVLEQLGIIYHFVSRKASLTGTLSYEDLTPEIIQHSLLIINTTPLGMYPNTDTCPPIPYEQLGSNHYLYDVVYNPAETLFLRRGKQQGARTKDGSDMLVIQAEASWTIWNQG